MITKEIFVDTINSLQKQIEYDIKIGEFIKESFGIEYEAVLYDNSIVTMALFKILQHIFPPEKSHCEIEHYCFNLNFGKPTPESEYESPKELYDRLIKYRKNE